MPIFEKTESNLRAADLGLATASDIEILNYGAAFEEIKRASPVQHFVVEAANLKLAPNAFRANVSALTHNWGAGEIGPADSDRGTAERIGAMPKLNLLLSGFSRYPTR